MAHSEPPESAGDRSAQRQVSREAFARFLAALSPDPEEAGQRYTRIHKKLSGFFDLKGLADSVNAADETIDRAARKIYAGALVPDAEKYCLGIARNLAKEKFRHEQREHASFLGFIENLANNSDEQVERIARALKPCFEELNSDDRQLLTEYCRVLQGHARAEHRRQLAALRQTTVLALRVRVTRLRGSLAECVRRRSNGAN